MRQKFRTLVSLYEGQKSRNAELISRNTDLQQQVETLKNKLQDLENRYETLKISKVLSSVPDEDVHSTKLQVNRIVREIDKCIALLNR